ncbi:hypothetical protein [Brevundimonas sp. LM2]|uniref:hypothetical protein n=1 Tax=Brevundimonas sp. LM2 TaxID=1938605 RepID=UPI00209B4A12|nr:hypothetical protein [Brevundimonas sp. LM2]
MSLVALACAETRKTLRTAALIARYDANLPRYTSYPTAAHFTPQVGAADWADWLGRVPAEEAVSLYAHIPFFRTLCWYCACNTRAVNRAETIRRVSQRPMADRTPLLEGGAVTPNAKRRPWNTGAALCR